MTRDTVVTCLALHAWREGNRLAPGSRSAMAGIAHIIGNRVLAGMWDGDWMKVLAHAHETAAHEPELDFSYPDVWNPDWRWLEPEVTRIYENRRPDDVTCSANTMQAGFPGGNRTGLFYCNLELPLRAWFKEKILGDPENHPRTAECHPLVFFG